MALHERLIRILKVLDQRRALKSMLERELIAR